MLFSLCVFQDFDGQARSENLSRIIVVLFGAVGLVWGYAIQQFSQTVFILGAGLALATLVRGIIMTWMLLGNLRIKKTVPFAVD